MVNKLVLTTAALVVVAGLASAEDFEAVIDDITRNETKRGKVKAPEKFCYSRVTLDSKGQLVYAFFKEGKVTKDTKVAMGVFDKNRKKWTAGEAVAGGVESDLFTDAGKWLLVRMTVADDKATIKQILVTNTDVKVERPLEFDAIYKGKGVRTNGRGPVSFVTVDRDDKGKIITVFSARQTAQVTAETKFVMGKYNAKEKTWEAGDEIPGGLDGNLLKDPGAKTIYVHITLRDDRRGIAQMLVTQIGEQRKK